MHTPGTNVFLFWVVGHFQKCFFLPNEPYVSDMCTYCCLTLVYYRPTSYISAVIYWVISHRHYFPNFSYFSRFFQKFTNFWTYNRKFEKSITCAWCVQIPQIFIYDINNTLSHTPQCGCGFRQDAGAGFDAGQGPTASFFAQLKKNVLLKKTYDIYTKQQNSIVGCLSSSRMLV